MRFRQQSISFFNVYSFFIFSFSFRHHLKSLCSSCSLHNSLCGSQKFLFKSVNPLLFILSIASSQWPRIRLLSSPSPSSAIVHISPSVTFSHSDPCREHWPILISRSPASRPLYSVIDLSQWPTLPFVCYLWNNLSVFIRTECTFLFYCSLCSFRGLCLRLLLIGNSRFENILSVTMHLFSVKTLTRLIMITIPNARRYQPILSRWNYRYGICQKYIIYVDPNRCFPRESGRAQGMSLCGRQAHGSRQNYTPSRFRSFWFLQRRVDNVRTFNCSGNILYINLSIDKAAWFSGNEEWASVNPCERFRCIYDRLH